MTSAALRAEPTSTAVVMCTHNGSRYVVEQLDTIAAQTRRIDELHVYDWGSTDDTLARVQSITERLAQSGVRCRVRTMQSAPGPARSFLEALADVAVESHATLVFIADQDDQWLPHKVGTCVAAFESMPFDLAFSDVEVFREDVHGDEVTPSFYGRGSPYRRPREPSGSGILLTNPAVGMSMCVQRTWLAHVKSTFGFDWIMHDWALMILCWITNARLRYLDEPLVRYRQHAGNVLGAATGRSALRRAGGAGRHVAAVRRQRDAAQRAALLLGAESTRAGREIASLAGRWSQVRAAAMNPLLTARYRLLLSASLLAF